MTSNPQTLDGVIAALVFAVFGALATIGIPTLFKWFSARLENATEREKRELQEDTTQDLIDMETRQLANRLAMKAFDREEELARRNAEYQAQGELLALTRQQLFDCRAALIGCNEVQVDEYRRHETELLERIHELETIIESIKARSEP